MVFGFVNYFWSWFEDERGYLTVCFLIFLNSNVFEANILHVRKPAVKDAPTIETIAKECQTNQKSI
jgi:hypothetical protein